MGLSDRLFVQLRARRDLVIVLVFALAFTAVKVRRKFQMEEDAARRFSRERRFGQIYRDSREG